MLAADMRARFMESESASRESRATPSRTRASGWFDADKRDLVTIKLRTRRGQRGGEEEREDAKNENPFFRTNRSEALPEATSVPR